MSTISGLEFSNLPADTIGKIIEKCDLIEQWVIQKSLATNQFFKNFRLTLRKVSKDLRSLVDEHKLAYKSIQIYLTNSFILCSYNGKNVTYASENWDEEYEEYEQEELGLAYEEFWIL